MMEKKTIKAQNLDGFLLKVSYRLKAPLIAPITQIMKPAPTMLKNAGTNRFCRDSHIAITIRTKQSITVRIRVKSCNSLGGSIIPYCIP